MEIIQWPAPVLKTVCDEVTEFNSALHLCLDQMWEVLEHTQDAMALAANQVGITQRFFIMKALDGFRWELVNPSWLPEEGYHYAHQEEGCLSTPGLFSMLPNRHDGIKVTAQDRHGKHLEFIAVELEAVCVQHEVDHLDGIFWFDRMPRNPRRAMERQWESIKGKQHEGKAGM